MAIESFPAPTQISYFTASRRHINYFPSPTVPAGRISARGVPDGDNKLHFKAVLETDTQHFAHFSARRYPKTVFGGRKRDHHADLRAFQCVTVPENGVRRAKTGPSRRVSDKKLRDGGKRYIKGRIREMPGQAGHDVAEAGHDGRWESGCTA